jgi:uncharacterized protein YacL
MKKKFYSKFVIKDQVLKNELARAHGMIILLVVALMVTLTIATSPDITFDPLPTFIAVIMLAVVGIISLSIIISITRKRKK